MIPSSNASQIERLTMAGRHGQWTVDAAFAGSQIPNLPIWAPRGATAAIVGLLREGERIAEAACHRISDLLPAGPARDFVQMQAADEARHAAAYDRYLALLGARPEPQDVFEPVRTAIGESDRSAHALVLINHLVLEDAALGAHSWLARHLPCPLLRRLIRRIGRDEARHVAFGRWFARQAAEATPETTRRADLAWARGVRARCTERVAAKLGALSSLLAHALPDYAARHEREQDLLLDALVAGPRARAAVPPC